MPLSGSSCNLVISSVSPGENRLLPPDKETKGQEEQGTHGGWLSSGETHPAEWRAVISGGRGLLFFCGAGDQAQGLVSSAQDASPVQNRKSHPSIPV